MTDDQGTPPPTQDPQPPANGASSQGATTGQPATPPPTQDPQPPANGASSQGATTGQPAGGTQQDMSGIMEENVDIGNLIASASNQQVQQDFIASVKIPPHPNTKFDEKTFVELLAGSISLTAGEKQRIILAIPKLSQFQIDELIKIFQEEKQKFTELEKKHSEQVAELEAQHKEGFQDIQAQKEEEERIAKEAKEAEDIKKNLGL